MGKHLEAIYDKIGVQARSPPARRGRRRQRRPWPRSFRFPVCGRRQERPRHERPRHRHQTRSPPNDQFDFIEENVQTSSVPEARRKPPFARSASPSCVRGQTRALGQLPPAADENPSAPRSMKRGSSALAKHLPWRARKWAFSHRPGQRRAPHPNRSRKPAKVSSRAVASYAPSPSATASTAISGRPHRTPISSAPGHARISSTASATQRPAPRPSTSTWPSRTCHQDRTLQARSSNTSHLSEINARCPGTTNYDLRPRS